jgi:hypothetical protein
MQNPACKAEPGFLRAALAVFIWGCTVVAQAWRPQAGFDFLDQIGARKLYVKAAVCLARSFRAKKSPQKRRA